MKSKTVLTILVLANLFGSVVYGQEKKLKHKPKVKVKIAVISFSESDKVEKVQISEEIKQAQNNHAFKEHSLDDQILGSGENLDSEVVYLQ